VYKRQEQDRTRDAVDPDRDRELEKS